MESYQSGQSFLDSLNAKLCSAGYSPIGLEQARKMHRTIGQEFTRWCQSYITHGAESGDWPSLRTALVAVHPTLAKRLSHVGLDVTQETMIRAVMKSKMIARTAVLVVKDLADPRELSRLVQAEMQQESAPQPPVDIESKVHHIYGAKAALTFEAAKTRTGRACLQVEAAGRLSQGRYDWPGKISVQLSDAETIQVMAVLRGWSSVAEVKNHGRGLDKYVTFKTQSDTDGWVCSVRHGTTARVVPIPTAEAFRLLSLVTKVLTENSPHLDAATLDQMVFQLFQAGRRQAA